MGPAFTGSAKEFLKSQIVTLGNWLVGLPRFHKRAVLVSIDLVCLIIAMWLAMSLRIGEVFVPAGLAIRPAFGRGAGDRSGHLCLVRSLPFGNPLHRPQGRNSNCREHGPIGSDLGAGNRAVGLRRGAPVGALHLCRVRNWPDLWRSPDCRTDPSWVPAFRFPSRSRSDRRSSSTALDGREYSCSRP